MPPAFCDNPEIHFESFQIQAVARRVGRDEAGGGGGGRARAERAAAGRGLRRQERRIMDNF